MNCQKCATGQCPIKGQTECFDCLEKSQDLATDHYQNDPPSESDMEAMATIQRLEDEDMQDQWNDRQAWLNRD